MGQYMRKGRALCVADTRQESEKSKRTLGEISSEVSYPYSQCQRCCPGCPGGPSGDGGGCY
ncbi:hypothetical protein DESHY_60121 [Desulforamulus hydrothermalis Lam5 = DSM 18033]|uniref:Uncharacterized protein n=1 Tax=Desulforamulus hydrothermalis Lam5 = DSM 18033 TaxID=1121428 RepID=K8E097_9FIRM|nr:hypothetical protein DESHY_60121 [Desulforamulus hydrothermalis Lam5 = DSM 18033]